MGRAEAPCRWKTIDGVDVAFARRDIHLVNDREMQIICDLVDEEKRHEYPRVLVTMEFITDDVTITPVRYSTVVEVVKRLEEVYDE